jgi:hypothetical protein
VQFILSSGFTPPPEQILDQFVKLETVSFSFGLDPPVTMTNDQLEKGSDLANSAVLEVVLLARSVVGIVAVVVSVVIMHLQWAYG